MPKIEVKDLGVTYIDKKKNETTVLENFNACFNNGKISVIMGENGCGKSTLLKAICCCFQFDGYIYFDDKNIETNKMTDLNISYVDQDFALYPHLSIYDNISYPLLIKKIDEIEIERRVNKIAEELGITLLLNRRPNELSIGQQQRVAIARALIKKPSVLLLDEIMSNLDTENQKKIRKLLKQLIHSYNITCLYVTHNIDDAMEMADDIYVMENGKIFLKKL